LTTCFLIPQKPPDEEERSKADTVVLVDLERDLAEVEEQATNGVGGGQANVDKIFEFLIKHKVLKLV
jgi:hypothetical protein